MHAFPAAKRAYIPLILIVLLVSAPTFAADDSGYLGVVLQDVSPSMAKALQLDDTSGVLVNEVVADSPAEKAGLQDGDVIVAFDGKPLNEYSDLSNAVRARKPGARVAVTVMRDGKEQDIEVELGERENDFAWSFDTGDAHVDMKGLHGRGEDGNVWIQRFGDGDELDVAFFNEDRGFLGVQLDDLNAQLGDYFGVEDGAGALVTEVVEDSPAAAAGLKAGDVIVAIGDDEVASAAGLHKLMSGTEAEQTVKVSYLREGKRRSTDVTLGEAPESEISRHVKVLMSGDHDGHFGTPKMLHRFHGGDGPHRRVEIIREIEDDELDEMRAELEKMRAELEEIRQELKK